ncbi:MAG: hypothetical protein ACLFPQ_05415 [Candidatus Woesearchaeota archaeon]
MRNKKAYLYIALFILLGSCASAYFYIETEEHGSVLDYYSEYYLVSVKGNLTIENRYNFSLYAIRIPFNPSSLTVFSLDEDVEIAGNSIRISLLEPNESFTFSYFVYGVATEDPFNDLYNNRSSALRDLIDNTVITAYADMVFSLTKAELGKTDVNRPLEVSITNPTELEYKVENLRIIKTHDEDINNEIYHIDINSKQVLYGYEEWTQAVTDTNSGLKESDIYWLYIDIVPQNFNILYNDSVDIKILSEENLDEFPKDTPAIPDSGGDSPSTGKTPTARVFLRKTAEPTRIIPGQLMNITLIVTNLEQQAKVIVLEDTIPDGFEFVDAYDNPATNLKIRNNKVQWTLEVNKDTSKVVYFTLRFIDNQSVGLDYLPAAVATYEGMEVLSPRVPIIKRFVPRKTLYLQKSLNYLSSDQVKVTLILKNMGETSISGLVLRDYFEANAPFSEITVSPESKGTWNIDELEVNEEWIVSYMTDNHAQIETLPSLYGIEDMYVLKTLIRENIVSRYVFMPGVNVIEFVGLVVVILFPMVFFYLRYLKKKLQRLKGEDY